MTRKRVVSEDERRLFEEQFKEARPLAETPAAHKTRGKTRSKAALTGIDGRTAERLRRGTMEPEARLDLHGFTEAAAHSALIAFLRSAQMRGHRLVLVVTGKGMKEQDPYAPFDLELAARSRGVLKSMVPRWLAEPSLGGIVADSRTAHRKHGGAGALYIYLRKPPR